MTRTCTDGQDGEHHIFKGPLQETKANEHVLVYDPESNTFVLERLASMSRLSATRSSRASTLTGAASIPNPSNTIERPVESIHHRSTSNDDVPTISLDPVTNTVEAIDLSSPDERVPPVLVTPRLPPVSPMQSRHPQQIPPDPGSSDDDSDIDIELSTSKADPDEDVSDEDLDNLANELESSLENHPGSSSSDAESDDIPGPPRPKAPDFGNVPRSGGPISMSRFAGGRRREEESSSSDDDDDD
jgi:hypothetical protein